jgi:predicted DNA-binding transcriptional regulator YafY
MSESSQLVRQWKLLLALESSHTGCTIQDLIAQLEMADKTIRRDLKVLKTVFRITETTGDKGRKRWHMQPLSEVAGFNLTDLLSIHMGRQFLEPLAGTPFCARKTGTQHSADSQFWICTLLLSVGLG